MERFSPKSRYTRVECDLPDYEGLWAEIRTNLTHDEREAFLYELAELDRKRVDWFATKRDEARKIDQQVEDAKDDKTREKLRKTRQDYVRQYEIDVRNEPGRADRLTLISPYVRAWNICDDCGVDVPAPSDGGIDVFKHADTVIEGWLIEQIINGYRGGKGVRTLSPRSDEQPKPTSGPQVVNETASP